MCKKYNPGPEKSDEEGENIFLKIKKKKEGNQEIKLAKSDQWVYDLFSINHLELKLKIFNFRFRNNFSFHNSDILLKVVER